MVDYLILFVGTGVGIYCCLAAVFNWNFFFSSQNRAAPIVGLLGRNGARVFYALLGLMFIAGAIQMCWNMMNT